MIAFQHSDSSFLAIEASSFFYTGYMYHPAAAGQSGFVILVSMDRHQRWMTQGPQYRPMGAIDGIKYPGGLCTHPCGGGDMHYAVFVLKRSYSHVKHAQLVSISSGTWTMGTGSKAPVPPDGGS